jgi:TatA/E family protein of Tat protein translocase
VVANIFGTDWIWVLLVVVVLFGGSQLPKLARNAGDAMKEFRKAHDEASETSHAVAAPPVVAGNSTFAQAPVPAAPALSQAPSTAPVVPVAGQPAQGATEERVSLTRSELDALLADREARAKSAQASGSQPQG